MSTEDQNRNISNEEFNELFQKFKIKFPPASNLKEAELRLTTKEILDMITDFTLDEEFPVKPLFNSLKESGYKYEPIEYNDKVTIYWLIMKAKEMENH